MQGTAGDGRKQPNIGKHLPGVPIQPNVEPLHPRCLGQLMPPFLVQDETWHLVAENRKQGLPAAGKGQPHTLSAKASWLI